MWKVDKKARVGDIQNTVYFLYLSTAGQKNLLSNWTLLSASAALLKEYTIKTRKSKCSWFCKKTYLEVFTANLHNHFLIYYFIWN